MGRTYTTKEDKESRNSRDRARRKLLTAKIERKCFFCDSIEELEVDHIDKNPLNNELPNLRYLCKVCHMVHHSNNASTKEDFGRCENCIKLRRCGTSPLDKRFLCERCFHNDCKNKTIDPHKPLEPIRISQFGYPVNLCTLWRESFFELKDKH